MISFPSIVFVLLLSISFLFSFPVSVPFVSGSPSDWVQDRPLSVARSDFRALTLNGGVYLLGGCQGNQTVGGSCPAFSQELTFYNFSSNSYTDLNSLASLNAQIRTRYGAAIMGQDLLFIGGRDNNDNILQSIDVFDTTTNSWVAPSLISFQTSLQRSDGCVFVIGQSIFYAGGYDATYTAYKDVYVLDTTLAVANGKRYGSFQAGVVKPKIYASGDCGATSIYGKGYVFGGFTNDGFITAHPWLERYDPSTNSWTVLASFIHPRGATGFAVIAGNLFIVGGESKELRKVGNSSAYWSIPTGDVEQYNLLNDSWSDVTPLAISRFRSTAAVWLATNRIYNFGGQGEPVITNPNDLVNGAYFPVLNSVYDLDVSQFLINTSALDVGHGVYSGTVYIPAANAASGKVSAGGAVILGIIVIALLAIELSL